MDAVARRPRRSRSQWRRLMADYEASGQSQQVFCHEHGLALSTFARWRRILAEQTLAVASDSAAEPQRLFAELRTPLSDRSLAETSPWEIELALGADMVLRMRRGEPC